MTTLRPRLVLAALLVGAALLVNATGAGASHSWGNYHWARTANPFTLRLGDNVSSAWDPYLATASSDWSVSGVLDTAVAPGTVNPKKCSATTGSVQVCNSTYGRNGWLGVAQIWVSGSHIAKGTVKVNDTYMASGSYNTPAWKQFVMCQEVGHTFGLDHQDGAFGNQNLGSCMDYTNDPGASTSLNAGLDNLHPNDHDYAQLDAIYEHLDSVSTVSASATGPGRGSSPSFAGAPDEASTPGEWGRLVAGSSDPHSVAVYERDLGAGMKILTFVIWAA